MSEKNMRKKMMDFIIGTFAFGAVTGTAEAQVQKNKDKEEFAIEKMANSQEFEQERKQMRTEFEQEREQMRAEFENYREQNRQLFKNYREANKILFENAQSEEVSPQNKDKEEFTIDKTSMAQEFEQERKQMEAEVKNYREQNHQSEAEKEKKPVKIINPDAYRYMSNVLPQMLYFMDVVDNVNRNIKVESNKRLYYRVQAQKHALKMGSMNEKEAEQYFAETFKGAEIITEQGLKFVAYKGKGYELRKSGVARWDSDSRSVTENSDIKKRIYEAIGREKYDALQREKEHQTTQNIAKQGRDY